ncbi:uncharacterized protein LOC130949562 [Arachis stenosperma]|uniref:uncharacterized protein LOC130949562 n=1 Tax=Arachis stenosperma TaxID=217475 RepID=UPI0025AD0778|nr:uncharacterized protein LOC130949562 [Arachis stenosperma]
MEKNQVAAVTTQSSTQEGVNTEEGGEWEQANYVGNSPWQNHDPYSKTYYPGLKNHPNFGWENQQDQGQDQRRQNHNPNNHVVHQHSSQRSYQQPPNHTPQHPYQNQHNHPHSYNPNPPSYSEDRLSRIENLLEGLCKEVQDNKAFKDDVRTNIKNQGDTIKRLEFQVGYLSQQIPKSTDSFLSDTEKNPKGEAKKVRWEECKMVTTSDEVNRPFIKALQQMPVYIKYIKELLTRKSSLKGGQTILMNKECNALIQPQLPIKRKDPGSFHIPCTIGETKIDKGLCDLGASINLMPFSLMK